MTLPTNDAIRIAVAEAMGWQCIHVAEHDSPDFVKGNLIGQSAISSGWCKIVPNYTESLDACREVFQYFYEHDTVVQLTFDHLLWRVELFYGDNEYIVVVDSQTLPLGITEAFLRLKGKWPVTSV